ncbi:hypothetical protein CERZMDRAFT_88619 [Cercospora zeae-maydis SCOH1-5]|uniref:NAD(P)-binding domain-containing protein n=1 Tax=Cercospora zeae-maydis SCOH1-5 TaxID=717836 RepID=A0A6A6F1C4_9PEZI|nr:hypothetical protein CERZMDRAFT_88619 [Cercospora zeae-maydis SCOH1-5]
MAHIILTGATGSAGAAILSHCLSNASIARVSILSRRDVKLAENQPKAHVFLHHDFEQYPDSLLEQLKGAEGCVWAQGISSRGISEADYTKITYDYPIAAAKAFATLRPKFNFVHLSGEGVDAESEKGMMYSRIKGRTEKNLVEMMKELESLKVYNVRPGVINVQGQYLAQKGVTMWDRFATGVGNLFEVVYKGMVVPAPSLARVMVNLATGDGEPLPKGVGVEGDGRTWCPEQRAEQRAVELSSFDGSRGRKGHCGQEERDGGCEVHLLRRGVELSGIVRLGTGLNVLMYGEIRRRKCRSS